MISALHVTSDPPPAWGIDQEGGVASRAGRVFGWLLQEVELKDLIVKIQI